MLCYTSHTGGRKQCKGSHFDGQDIPWRTEKIQNEDLLSCYAMLAIWVEENKVREAIL